MVGTTGADGEDTRSWKLEEFYNADDRLPNGEPGGESKCAMGFFFFFFFFYNYWFFFFYKTIQQVMNKFFKFTLAVHFTLHL